MTVAVYEARKQGAAIKIIDPRVLALMGGNGIEIADRDDAAVFRGDSFRDR